METSKKQKTNIRRRFEFIEFCLYWEGEIGRPQLQEQFLISPQQATIDLNTYLDKFPGGMMYNPRKRSYMASHEFRPSLISEDPSEYFMHIEMLSKEYRTRDKVWIQSLPKFEIVSAPSRQLTPKVVQTVIYAIKQKQAFRGYYTSMSSDTSNEQRTLIPHAIASDGHRWHVRAFHIEKERFSDFVLSRLTKVFLCENPVEDMPSDEAWKTMVPVIFEPDKAILNEKQCAQLVHEYNMEGGLLRIEARKAMLFYVLRHYGFNPNPRDLENDSIRNKSSFGLKIKNLREVDNCLARRN